MCCLYENKLFSFFCIFLYFIFLNHTYKDHASVLVEGTCQIPDPVYKLVGSIICFYIPLIVMLITYYLTVRLLARQRQNLGGCNQQTSSGWAVGWLGHVPQLGNL